MFRLHKVLEWKRALERRARVERVAAEARAAALERTLDRLRALREEVPDVPEGDDPVAELAGWARWTEGLRARETRVRARLDRHRPAMEEKVRRHVELRREVKGLVRLEEKARLARRRRIERSRQEAIDDAASRTKLPAPGTDFLPEEPALTPPARAESTEDAGEGDFHRNRGTRT